jgi:hypothetical protein
VLFGGAQLVNTRSCCEVLSTSSSRKALERTAIGGPHPRTLARRCLDLIGCVVPGATLVLLPKCPACLVAYFAFATGIGISMATAFYLRMLLVALFAASLFFLAVRHGRHLITVLRPHRWMDDQG